MAGYAWLSFLCVSCGDRKDNEEKHTLVNGNCICDKCVERYHPCGDCGLYMSGTNKFCADCTSDR